jgi:hypothetical protein
MMSANKVTIVDNFFHSVNSSKRNPRRARAALRRPRYVEKSPSLFLFQFSNW